MGVGLFLLPHFICEGVSNNVFQGLFFIVEKKIILKKIKNWEVGNYIIEVEANDKYDQKVEDKAQFDVFNSKKPKIADNQLFEISTDKLSYKPNEIVKLKIGSASKELFVTIAIEKDYQIVNQQIIKLTNKNE